jgi:hypothetical protein
VASHLQEAVLRPVELPAAPLLERVSAALLGVRTPWLVRPLVVFLYSRLLVVGAALGGALHAHVALNRVFESWDGSWYMAVVTSGYPHGLPSVGGKATSSTVGFFPLFPDVVTAVHTVTRLPYFAAAVMVTTFSGAAAASLLWLLVRQLANDASADRACMLWCFFPGSFVLTLFYTEGLMIALVLGCLLALSHHRWWTAGVLAGLATATRPNAVVIVACCAWAAAVAIKHRRDWRSLVAPLLAPSGLLAYCSFLWVRTGSFSAYFRVQHDGWGQQLDPTNVFAEIGRFVQHPLSNAEDTAEIAALVFVVIAAVLLVRLRPPPILVVWAAGIIGVALLAPVGGIRARFILSAFPLVIVAALYLRGRAFAVYVTVSAVLLGYVTALAVSTITLTP